MTPDPAFAPHRDGRGLTAHTTEVVNGGMPAHALNVYMSTHAVHA